MMASRCLTRFASLLLVHDLLASPICDSMGLLPQLDESQSTGTTCTPTANGLDARVAFNVQVEPIETVELARFELYLLVEPCASDPKIEVGVAVGGDDQILGAVQYGEELLVPVPKLSISSHAGVQLSAELSGSLRETSLKLGLVVTLPVIGEVADVSLTGDEGMRFGIDFICPACPQHYSQTQPFGESLWDVSCTALYGIVGAAALGMFCGLAGCFCCARRGLQRSRRRRRGQVGLQLGGLAEGSNSHKF